MSEYRIERRMYAAEPWRCMVVCSSPVAITSIKGIDMDDSSPYALRGLPGAELRTTQGDKTVERYVWSALYPRNPADPNGGHVWGWKITERNAVQTDQDMAVSLSFMG